MITPRTSTISPVFNVETISISSGFFVHNTGVSSINLDNETGLPKDALRSVFIRNAAFTFCPSLLMKIFGTPTICPCSNTKFSLPIKALL